MKSVRLRYRLLRLLIAFTQRFGTRLRNVSGEILCRAILVPWRGRIHVIGLPLDVQLRPVPLPQAKLSYWRQSLAWEQASAPDFPAIGRAPAASHQPLVCHVIICHLPPAGTAAVSAKWEASDPSARVLIAYGGTKENFDLLDPCINAVYVPDASLRTTGHVSERQSYQGVFRSTLEWLARHGNDATHVHLAEYDVIPVVPEVGRHLVSVLAEEDADIAGYGLVDITGTIHPHNRYEISSPEFSTYLESISPREVKDRSFSMLGCSSIWTRAAFEAVAVLTPPPTYLEIAMPTLAHHSGCRVRPMPQAQQYFVTFKGDYSADLADFTGRGAWLIHPCKEIWTSS